MTVSNVQTNASSSYQKASLAKGKQDVSNSFQAIMNMGSQSSVNTKESDAVKTQKVDKQELNNDRSSQDVSDDKIKKEPQDIKEDASVKNVDKENTATDDVANDVKKDPVNEVEAAVTDAVADAVSDIKDMVMDTLSITEDQLDQMLQSMGMNLLDLLNPQMMAKLVMNQGGLNNPGELLNNSELTNLVKTMNEQVTGILKENGLTVSEQGQLQYATENEVYAVEIAEEAGTENEVVSKNPQLPEGDKSKNTTPEVTITSDVSSEKDAKSNESSFSGQEAFSREKGQPTPENITVNGNQILQNLNQQVHSVFAERFAATQQTEIVNQVLEAIKVTVKADMTTMELQLNPASLGKVHIQVAAKDGVMTAQINAQTEAAKNAIESQLITLKEAFQNQGLKVEAVEVSVSPHGFQQRESGGENEEQAQNNKGKRRLNLNLEDLDIGSDLTEDEEIAVELMKEQGNSVDYSA